MGIMKELPEGWTQEKLGSVCKINMGQSPPSETYNFNNVGLPFFQGKAEFTDLYPHPVKWCSAPKKIAEPGDLLLSVRAPVGAINIANQKCSIGRGLASIRYPDCKLFIYYFLKLVEKELDNKGTGTTFRAISGDILRNTTVPFPPLNQQKQIVNKIEELFSELDKGIENLKVAQLQLKIYRHAVLKNAYEGLKSKTTVGKLFDFIGGGTPSKKEFSYWDGSINWASVKDVKGDFLNQTRDKITEKGLKYSASNLAHPGEIILITRISPGKVIISNIATAINQDLKIVKPKFKFSSKYVYYLFKSIEWDCLKLSSGTTVLGINLTSLKAIEIPDVDIELQNKIVSEIESRLSVCDKIEETIKVSLQQTKALRHSILQKAFEGKLFKVQVKPDLSLNNVDFIKCNY
jgi:type I restriction enzyme S subunit